jgi:hypothetical protein
MVKAILCKLVMSSPPPSPRICILIRCATLFLFWLELPPSGYRIVIVLIMQQKSPYHLSIVGDGKQGEYQIKSDDFFKTKILPRRKKLP